MHPGSTQGGPSPILSLLITRSGVQIPPPEPTKSILYAIHAGGVFSCCYYFATTPWGSHGVPSAVLFEMEPAQGGGAEVGRWCQEGVAPSGFIPVLPGLGMASTEGAGGVEPGAYTCSCGHRVCECEESVSSPSACEVAGAATAPVGHSWGEPLRDEPALCVIFGVRSKHRKLARAHTHTRVCACVARDCRRAPCEGDAPRPPVQGLLQAAVAAVGEPAPFGLAR